MRILVLSDSHGRIGALIDVLLAYPESTPVLFLGDGIRDAEEAAQIAVGRPLYMVRGNNDFSAGGLVPETQELVLGGKRLFLTHGHRFGVKSGLDRVVAEARRRGADVLLYGHTHVPFIGYENGLHILCPGSLRYSGSYGLLDITPAGIVPLIREDAG